ncbi:MAG: serine/threonine protein kinase [Myxococcota bacterium]
MSQKDPSANLHLVQSTPTLHGVVGGRYRLGRPLETVPLGRRYRCVDDRLGTHCVALVLSVRMSPDHADPWCERRFMEAAQFAQGIALHGAVPMRAVEHFESERMHHVVIVEDDPGVQSLQETLKSGAMSRQASKDLLRKICNLIQQAHELGMLHLDLNPQQIFVARDGSLRITGFALRGAFQADVAPDMPERGSYLAPELRTGGSLSPATDVFALGRLYQAMLCGVTRGAPQMTPLPDDADRIVRRSTRLEPNKRFISVTEFLGAVNGEYTDDPMSGRPWQATPVASPQRRALSPIPRIGPTPKPAPVVTPSATRPPVAEPEEDKKERGSILPWVLVAVLLLLLLLSILGFIGNMLWAGGAPYDVAEGPQIDAPPPDMSPRPPPPITVNSEPIGAMVYEGETPLGKTPLHLEPNSGGIERILTLKLEGRHDSTFILQEMTEGEVNIPLELRVVAPAVTPPTPPPRTRTRRAAPARAGSRRSGTATGNDAPLMLER